MFMTAIEGTIVATAMPRIVADLGGFALYSWVFSIYMLTQVVTIPIYGKLADLYGRKPVFAVGTGIFLVGSFLCGQARGMLPLIAFRALQGFGSGAVQPIATTLAGDLYPAEERHRVQGWISSVWAVSSIVGPSLGGLIVQFGHWPWIFYLNIPLGIVAIAGVLLFLHEPGARKDHQIDYAGALLLVLAVAPLMLGLLQGQAWGWASPLTLGLFAVALAGGGLLLWREGRAAEPIIPLWIFRHRLLGVAAAATFFPGALMMGYTAMVPTFVQGVQGGSALAAGMALAVMSIGWPLASTLSGRVMGAVGYKRTALLGGGLQVLGALGIALGAGLGVPAIAACVFLVGMGLGFMTNALIITIQGAVPWHQRGVATATNMFMRSLGATVGVAALGAILNAVLLANHSPEVVNHALDAARTGALGGDVVASLARGIQLVFWASLGVGALGLAVAAALPAAAPSEAS
jgi:EmrB/QacA subfamily drug resistance transporter